MTSVTVTDVVEGEWLTQKEAAAFIGKSRPTITVWMLYGRRKVGKLPYIEVGPRKSKMILKSVLIEYAAKVQRPGYPAGRPRK